MRYGVLAAKGIVIYAVMYLLWSGFMLYGFTEGLLPRVAALLVLVGLALSAGRALRLVSWKDILPYSITWTVIVALLDSILTVPFTGWALFSDWNLWVGYSLILIVPLFAPRLTKPERRPADTHAV